jgi:ribosomal protein S18 acetylase RimI-like enzyme
MMGGEATMEIRRVTAVPDVVAAEVLFDGPARPDWASRFLAAPGHHLLVAYVESVPAGMVTGVEMTHPDKGTEMFLYELGVADEHQGRGIGRALVSALADLARAHDCYGMWVLTDRDNPAALATYRAAGATGDDDHVMLSWTFQQSTSDVG